MTQIIDPDDIAARFRQDAATEVNKLDKKLKLVGFLTCKDGPSRTYAEYTRIGCQHVGVEFDLRTVDRLRLEWEIEHANDDPAVHGIIIYYPVFNTDQDNYIKDLVEHSKDVEGLSNYWVKRLYQNVRHVDGDKGRKSILPCTPLAILKLLTAAGIPRTGQPFAGRTVAIFNRSEVVGRPLAAMMANDGARVYSFDFFGPLLFQPQGAGETTISRSGALKEADIVITGVPDRSFPLIQPDEIRPDIIGINFSTIKNFTKEAIQKTQTFIPRVGPMTVTMALRNTLRLHRNYHRALD